MVAMLLDEGCFLHLKVTLLVFTGVPKPRELGLAVGKSTISTVTNVTVTCVQDENPLRCFLCHSALAWKCAI